MYFFYYCIALKEENYAAEQYISNVQCTAGSDEPESSVFWDDHHLQISGWHQCGCVGYWTCSSVLAKYLYKCFPGLIMFLLCLDLNDFHQNCKTLTIKQLFWLQGSVWMYSQCILVKVHQNTYVELWPCPLLSLPLLGWC